MKKDKNRLIVRVDERLIHAQILIGWVAVLGLRTLILASTKLLADQEGQELFALIVPDHIRFEVMSENAAGKFAATRAVTIDSPMG